MDPRIIKASSLHELMTPERCFIAENWSSEKVSIARAKVKPGTATAEHSLEGVDEIYLVTEGKGRVEVGTLKPASVETGDTIFIPSGTKQRIANVGKTNLVFYCICTPKFSKDCYREPSTKAKPQA
jgi:mannose-6-phosphate isomerase-like protein (cupin superfamily)